MARYVGEESTQARRRLESLAWLMDHSIPIPGTDFRIGLDGLIGLFPAFGDALGALVSSYIIKEAARLGAPRSVLLKMAFNVGVDAVLGIIPVLGDLFDLAWKANRRNVRLLEAYLERPRKTAAVSGVFVFLLTVLIIAVVLAVIIFGALLVRWLWLQVSGK